MNESAPILPSTVEEVSVDEKELRHMAADLFEKNRNAILTHKETGFGRHSISEALKQFPDDILANYRGHGVTRGDAERNLAAAISMLRYGFFLGSEARLAKSGFIDAWTDGDFLAVSRRGEPLTPRPNQQAQRVKFESEFGPKYGLKLDLGALVVTNRLSSVIDELRQMFPHANIISAAELPQYIREQEDAAGKSASSGLANEF